MCSLSEAMSAKTEAVTTQNAAQPNKNRTGTRHEASISAGATGAIARAAGETDGDDEGIALIEKKAANPYSKGSFVNVGFLRSFGWGRRRLFDTRDQIGTRRRRILPLLQGQFHRALDGQADDALVFVHPIVFIDRLGISSALVLQKLVPFLDSLGTHWRGLRVVPHRQHQHGNDKKGAEDADRVSRQAGRIESRWPLTLIHRSPPLIGHWTLDIGHFIRHLRARGPRRRRAVDKYPNLPPGARPVGET